MNLDQIVLINQGREFRLAPIFEFAGHHRLGSPAIEKFGLFLLARQPMQHCATPLWRNSIFVERASSFSEPSQPSLPFRPELGFHLFAQSLSESTTVASGGNRDLKRSPSHHSWVIEITEWSIANDIAQNLTPLRFFIHHLVEGLQRCGHNYQEDSV